MKKCLVFFVICLGLLASVSAVEKSPTINVKPNEVIPEEALDSLPSESLYLLNSISPLNHADYGFENYADLARIDYGSPIKLYQITPESILDYEPDCPVGALLKMTCHWYLPLLVSGQIRSLILVEQREDDAYLPVSLGYAKLAELLNKAYQSPEWAQEGSKLVVVYQAEEFFLANPMAKPQTLFPLQVQANPEIEPSQDLFTVIQRITPTIQSKLRGGY
ncbi:MAG: hypothetical protein PHI68_03155 [Candidatus Cloacimonetes bacterium]|nr:hypothetical protein [Candidatus Cloacimonadota bacterium]